MALEAQPRAREPALSLSYGLRLSSVQNESGVCSGKASTGGGAVIPARWAQAVPLIRTPLGAWGPQVIRLGRAQSRHGQRKRGWGGGCSAHCGTTPRRSRTLEGLPFGSRWSGLDRPSVGGAWPGSAAMSEDSLVLGLDLEGCKIHSRYDLVPALATPPSALAFKTLREQEQLFS